MSNCMVLCDKRKLRCRLLGCQPHSLAFILATWCQRCGQPVFGKRGDLQREVTR